MRKADGIEREVKLAVTDLQALRERLAELEAERLSTPAFEDNWLFDREGELARRGCVLRLRQDRHGARLTFKGTPSFEGNLKVRVEHESRVRDADELRAILEGLGYRVIGRYQKHREEWQLGGVRVALDHTPIGDFAEFEGDRAEKVAQRCGFDPTRAEGRTYPEIYAEHHRNHPESPEEMVFP
jgi:predicted adenylyl cyclase CyaB